MSRIQYTCVLSVIMYDMKSWTVKHTLLAIPPPLCECHRRIQDRFSLECCTGVLVTGPLPEAKICLDTQDAADTKAKACFAFREWRA